MQENKWALIVVLAGMGGIVSNIIKPKRRGLWGFAGAGVVGIFCGAVAGIGSVEFGLTVNSQLMIAAIVGVVSDRLLTFLLSERVVVNNQYNSGDATGIQGNEITQTGGDDD